jgi:hypothetical protein
MANAATYHEKRKQMEFKIKDPTVAKSKKAFKDATKAGFVHVRNMSDIFEPPYSGDIRLAPVGRHTVVGPCPLTNRKWYASVEIHGNGTIVVK